MQVVLLVAALVILGGVVLAALGRVGEMATFASDTAPMDLDEVSATDVALLRPPMSLWGYNAQATEDALRVIARSVTARDVEIATLRRELADLRAHAGAPATRTGPLPAARTGDRPAGAPAGAADGTPASGAPSAQAAASQPPDPLAAYRPPAQATASHPPDQGAAAGPPAPEAVSQPAVPGAVSQPAVPGAVSQPAVPGAVSQPAAPGAEAQPAGPPPAEPPREADPPTEDSWIPLWQRSSEPGPDE